MQLNDDRYRFYLADPIVVNPFENDDDLPAGATIALLPSFFDPGVTISSNATTLTVDGGAVASNIGSDLIFVRSYGVRDSNGELFSTVGDFGFAEITSAEITFEGMQGIPGLGGARAFELLDLAEADGEIRFDFADFIDPNDDYNFTILSASGEIGQTLGNYNVEIAFTIDGSELVFDSNQFSFLDSGQQSTIDATVVVTNGTETVTNTLFLAVSGETVAGRTITTSDSNGAQTGTRGDDRIQSVANEMNRMTGGFGEDTFVFGSDYTDGNADSDTITDFEAGLDLLLFENGVLITEILPIQDGLAILTRDGDMLTVFGDGLDLRDIRMQGVQFYDAAKDTPLNVQSGSDIALDLAVIQTIQTIDYWYS